MPRASRSSLTDHRFPAFYACYLLKSVRTPRATATYIGSTPSPPRRIRQHNGQISQGAWKTKHSRPWVMQMIVHGFPSKLAALQFEWAWQHPYISRHLRDDGGKAMFNSSGRFKYLNTNVRVARSMVSSHPYNTWPLSVKLFTEEAAKIWNSSATDAAMPPLPEGLKISLEFEGVDGKSGKPGSGRTGPIDVMDVSFTATHLQKAASVFTPNSLLRCSICHEAIAPDADPLTTALCPTSECKAVSHLACLSRDFLSSSPSTSSDIIPRGGTCKSCHSYVLWGDVIRGCYRRHQGGATPENEPEEQDDQEDGLEQLFGEAAEELERPPQPRKAAAPPASGTAKRGRGRPPKPKPASFSTVAGSRASSDDEHEHFDLDAISSCDEESSDDGLPWTRTHLHAHSKPPSRSGPSGSQLPNTLPKGKHTLSRPKPRSQASGTARDGLDRGVQQEASGRMGAGLEDRGAGSITAPGSAVAAAGRASSRDSHGMSQVPTGSRPAHADDATVLPHSNAGDDAVYARALLSQPHGHDGHRAPVEIPGAGLPRTLKPFPDLPPLSQPPSPAASRSQRPRPFNNEVVEISDSD